MKWPPASVEITDIKKIVLLDQGAELGDIVGTSRAANIRLGSIRPIKYCCNI